MEPQKARKTKKRKTRSHDDDFPDLVIREVTDPAGVKHSCYFCAKCWRVGVVATFKKNDLRSRVEDAIAAFAKNWS